MPDISVLAMPSTEICYHVLSVHESRSAPELSEPAGRPPCPDCCTDRAQLGSPHSRSSCQDHVQVARQQMSRCCHQLGSIVPDAAH